MEDEQKKHGAHLQGVSKQFQSNMCHNTPENLGTTTQSLKSHHGVKGFTIYGGYTVQQR